MPPLCTAPLPGRHYLARLPATPLQVLQGEQLQPQVKAKGFHVSHLNPAEKLVLLGGGLDMRVGVL